MRNSQTKEIDGLKVTTQQLLPRRAFKLAARLLKYLAPVFGSMDPESTEEIDLKKLTPAIVGMMRDLNDDEIDTLLSQVFASTMVIRDVDGKPVKYELLDPAKIDGAFDGKFGALIEAMKMAIEVNFGDFFADVDKSAAGATSSP